jgi:outer membrane protein
MNTTKLALLVSILISASGLFAALADSKTLAECIELGLKNSRSLHSAALNNRLLQAGLAEAGNARLPSLTLGARYSRLSPLAAGEVTLGPPISGKISLYPAIENNYSLTASLQQPLFTGLRIRQSIAQARAQLEEGSSNYRQQQQSLLYQVRLYFWNLVKAQEVLKYIQDNIEQVNAHLKEIEDLYARGLLTYNEVLKGRLQLADVTLRELEAENARALVQARLNILIGLPPQAAFEPTFSLARNPEPPGPLESLIAAALRQRPETAAMLQRLKAARAGIGIARSGWYPGVFLAGNYQYALPNPRQFPPTESFVGTWDVGVMASVDVGRWPSVARKTEQAVSQLAQVQEALGQLQDAIALEVIQAYLELKKSAEQIGVAEQIVQQAEENYKIIDKRFKNGLALSTDLLDAELARLEGNLELSQARVDNQIAQAALLRALGSQETPGE